MPDLYWIINKSSNSDNLKKLISLRAFLLDEADSPWALTYDYENNNDLISYLKDNEINYFLNLNTKNIIKLNIKATDIISMPKNKKLKFISMLDPIIDSLLDQNKVITDNIRINPFAKDKLLNFILENKININKDLFELFIRRNDNLLDLLSISNFNYKLNYNCSYYSKEYKIRNYWKNMWSDSIKYNDNSIIENIKI